jgi:hypothetical protein
MTAPLVAGAAALYLQEEPWITPDEVWRAIRADTAKGVLKRIIFNKNNILLNIRRFVETHVPVQGPFVPKPTKECGIRDIRYLHANRHPVQPKDASLLARVSSAATAWIQFQSSWRLTGHCGFEICAQTMPRAPWR